MTKEEKNVYKQPENFKPDPEMEVGAVTQKRNILPSNDTSF